MKPNGVYMHRLRYENGVYIMLCPVNLQTTKFNKMELKEFKQQIEQAESGKTFDYGISEPFSWRGSYDEVAFEILEQPMTREEILANIEKAYTGTFYGWKGGKYTYEDYTDVHFEEDNSRWTDGGYCSEMIAKIEGGEIYQSQEMRLVKLAFS